MMNLLFDINAVMLTVFNYPLNYAELLGTLFGLLTVILAARANIWTWPTGIIMNYSFLLSSFKYNSMPTCYYKLSFLQQLSMVGILGASFLALKAIYKLPH